MLQPLKPFQFHLPKRGTFTFSISSKKTFSNSNTNFESFPPLVSPPPIVFTRIPPIRAKEEGRSLNRIYWLSSRNDKTTFYYLFSSYGIPYCLLGFKLSLFNDCLWKWNSFSSNLWTPTTSHRGCSLSVHLLKDGIEHEYMNSIKKFSWKGRKRKKFVCFVKLKLIFIYWWIEKEIE